MKTTRIRLLLTSVATSVGMSMLLSQTMAWGADGPIAVADIKRDGAIDFEKEVLPILRKKCLACHNATKAESDLILETPVSILKGGGLGPAAEAGKGADSLLIMSASRQGEPFMPPDGNKVSAERLTPEELGLIKLWIDQGAKGEVLSSSTAIHWQALPPGVNPIYAVAVTPDGQYAAAGRANQIFVYHVPSKRELGRLTDPSLIGAGIYTQPGVADLDMIQSLRFSPSGEWLASGGYRTVKLWHRPQNAKEADLPNLETPAKATTVSPDGKLLACGQENGKIQLFDLATKQLVRSIAAHSAPVTSLAFSTNSNQLVSASKDKSWRVWNVADGVMVTRVDTPSEIHAAAFLAKDSQVATGGQDNLLRIWSLPAAPSPVVPALTAPVTALAASFDKKWLAIGSADGKVALLDVQQHALARTFDAHIGSVGQISFNASSSRMTTLGVDRKVKIWDLVSGQNLSTLSAGATVWTAATINPPGTQVAVGAQDGSLRSWKMDVAEPRPFAGDTGAPLTVWATSNDRRFLAHAGIVDGKHAVVIRDIASGNVTRNLLGHEAAVISVSFSLDGARLISGSEDKTARIWNMADGAEVAKLVQHNAAVTRVALTTNGQQAITVAADNVFSTWNLADGKQLFVLGGHTGAIAAITVSNDNQFVLSASVDRSLRWWNIANGQQARAADVAAEATTLALSRDGQRIAVAGNDNNVRIYQVGDGQLIATLAGHATPVRAISYSADNSRVLTSDGKQLMVWDAVKGTNLEEVMQDTTLATFGTDNQSYIGAHADKIIRAHTLRIERVFGDHAKPISGVAFSTDGQGLLTACHDGTLRRFVAATGQQQFAANHGAPVHALAISANGQWAASAGEDKQIKVFNAANGSPAPKHQFAGFAGAVKSVVFSLDSNKIAGADGAANQVHTFDVNEGTLDQVFAEHAAPATVLVSITKGDQAPMMVSAAGEPGVKIWQALACRKIPGHSQPITSLAAINDTQLLSGCVDGNVRHWDSTNGQMIRQMGHGGPVESVTARADGQRFASASANNTIKLWNGGNGEPVAEMKGEFRSQIRITDLTRAVALAKRKVDSANADLKAAQERKTAEEKNATTVAEAKKKADEELIKKVEAAKQPVVDKEAADKALADAIVAQTKAEVALKAADELLKKVTEALPVAQQEVQVALKASTDAATLVTQAAEKLVKAQEAAKADANNAALVEAVKAAEKESLDAVAKNKLALEAKVAAEKKLADADVAKKAGDEGKKKADQDLATAKTTQTQADAKVKQVTPVAQKALEEKSAAERAVQAAIRSVERATVSVQKATEEIPVHEAVVAKETESSKKAETVVEEGKKASTVTEMPVRKVVFSTDGKTLFSAGDDQLVHSWESDSGLPVETFAGHAAPITSVAVLPNGNIVSSAANHTTVIWKTAPEWKLERVIGNVNDPSQLIDRVTAIDFSPDGKVLATGSGEPSRSGQLKFWDVSNGTLVRDFKDPHSDTILGLEFSPDGLLIASSGADRFAKVFQVADGKFVRAFEGHTHHVLGVTWRADGRLLATGGADSVIKIWNTRTGDQERTIQGFGKEVTSLRFVAEGDNLIASAGDNSVRMKNAANGGNVRDYGGSTDFVYSVSVSADGKFIIAGGQDSTVRVWTGENGQLFTAFEAPKPAANK